MPMTGAGLADAIFNLLAEQSWFNSTDPSAQQLCNDLGNAIVTYIQGNATVLPLTLGVPTLIAPSGGGPVTGVGSIE
jgi:hypothetical protein